MRAKAELRVSQGKSRGQRYYPGEIVLQFNNADERREAEEFLLQHGFTLFRHWDSPVMCVVMERPIDVCYRTLLRIKFRAERAGEDITEIEGALAVVAKKLESPTRPAPAAGMEVGDGN